MRRDAPQLVLLSLHGFVVVASALFHWAVRPRVLESYRTIGAAVPWQTRLALGDAALPTAIAASLLLLTIGALSPQRRRRLSWWAAAVTVAGFAFTAAVLAAFAPLLRGAS